MTFTPRTGPKHSVQDAVLGRRQDGRPYGSVWGERGWRGACGGCGAGEFLSQERYGAGFGVARWAITFVAPRLIWMRPLDLLWPRGLPCLRRLRRAYWSDRDCLYPPARRSGLCFTLLLAPSPSPANPHRCVRRRIPTP